MLGGVETVGRIAHEAGVKTLVLSHLSPNIDGLDDDTWRAPAARYFKGEILGWERSHGDLSSLRSGASGDLPHHRM